LANCATSFIVAEPCTALMRTPKKGILQAGAGGPPS